MLETDHIEGWYRLVVDEGVYRSGPPRTDISLNKLRIPSETVLTERENLNPQEGRMQDLIPIGEKFDPFPQHDSVMFTQYSEILANPERGLYLVPFFERSPVGNARARRE